MIFKNEVLILKDGKIINGKIIKMDEDTMTVYSKDGEYIIDKEDIKIIYFNEEEYKKNKNILIEKDTKYFAKLYNFAEDFEDTI